MSIKIFPGVNNTSPGVNNTRPGVINARPGVINTRTGVNNTRAGVIRVGVESCHRDLTTSKLSGQNFLLHCGLSFS